MRRFTYLIGCLLVCSSVCGGSADEFDRALEQGQALAAAGDIAGALAIYQSLSERHPNAHQVFGRLGGMQLLDRRYAAAVRSFQRAITLGDASTRPFIGLGMAYLHLGQPGLARAAFVEARARGLDDPQDIDAIIAWIDARPDANAR